jgi:hypothetical protein
MTLLTDLFFILPFAGLSFGWCKSLLIARYPKVTERYRALLHSWFKGKIKQWGRPPRADISTLFAQLLHGPCMAL